MTFDDTCAPSSDIEANTKAAIFVTSLCRGGFRGSSLGSLEPPFLKLAMYQQTLTEHTLQILSSDQLCSHIRLPKLDPRKCARVIRGVVLGKWVW